MKRNELLIQNMDEFQSIVLKWKKPDTKEQILYDSIYMKF